MAVPQRGVRNVWKGDDDSGGKKPSEVFGCWAVAELTHTKLSSEPLCLIRVTAKLTSR